MNTFCRISALSLLGVALLLAGCPKKPDRPDPSATVLGPMEPGTGVDTGLSPTPVDAELDSSAIGLVGRYGDGFIEDADTIRGLLPSVYFDFDRSAIRSGDRPKLMQAAEYLRNHPEQRLLIEGHCDWRGTTEYNLGLGDRRANSVKQFLLTLGIPDNRLETLSKGDLEAIEGGTEQQMQEDRRAELIVLKQ